MDTLLTEAYIADRNGGVDWLAGQGNESETIDAWLRDSCFKRH